MERSHTALWLGERAILPSCAQSLGHQMGPVSSRPRFGPVVTQDGPDPYPMASIDPQHLVDEAPMVWVWRTGPRTMATTAQRVKTSMARELVHLAHALELADVERIHADVSAGPTAGQAEPEGLVLSGRFGHQPVVAA